MCIFKSSCDYATISNTRDDDYVPNYCTNYDLKQVISTKNKLGWLRSNFIGSDLEFYTPFGKRLVTYADCTATGRCLHFIEDYLLHNVLPFYGNTHTSDSYVGQETTKMVTEATTYIKSCLGAGENDALLCCGSGSTTAIKRLQEVIGIAIPSILRDKMLQVLRNEERWVVFVGPHEHHSNYLSWNQSLAQVVEIGMNKNGLFNFEELKQKLEFYELSKRPMLGSFSACSNVTGICLDTREVARLLHLHGAFACFDFAASGPYEEIKMRSGEIDGYDAIFLSPHKFPGGPGTPGILVMNKGMYQLGSSPPSTCGGGTVNFVNGFKEKDTLYVNDIEERENAGTPPIIQKIKAALAFWVKEYISYEVIQNQEACFIEIAMKRLLLNPCVTVLGNTKTRRHAIMSFLVHSYDTREDTSSTRGKPLHGAFIVKLLNDLFGIQARGGCACAGPYAHQLLDIDHRHSLALRSYVEKGYLGVKPGWARINFPYYMSHEEFEFILLAVEFIASFGQRFLSVYNFDWKTGEWCFSEQSFQEITQEKRVECTFLSKKLACDLKGLSLEGDHDFDEEDTSNAKRVTSDGELLKQKHRSYLENAMNIANCIPKYPNERVVPEDIDLEFLLYRV